MSTWSFVDATTGEYTGQRFSGPEHALEANTPAGCRAVEGVLADGRPDDPELRRARVLDQIEALERKQLRPARELAMDPTNGNAARRLTEIEAEIARLREGLK